MRGRAWVGLALAALAGAGCGGPARERGSGTSMTLAEVVSRRGAELLGIPGVVGVAEGLSGGRPAVIVLVAQDSPEIRRRIPASLDAYPVEIRVTGEIRAQD